MESDSDAAQQIQRAQLRGLQRRLFHLRAARGKSENTAPGLLPINAEIWTFERNVIIGDEGSELTYMEGCTAPKFNTATLHSAVVELVAMKGAKLQYITVQNWSSNVFNLVTKRGIAHEDAEVKWIDCNIGSRLTMKYPGVIMKGRRARGEVLSIALAGDGQHQDTGAKMVHAADETTVTLFRKQRIGRDGTTRARQFRNILRTARTTPSESALLTREPHDTYLPLPSAAPVIVQTRRASAR